MSWTTGIIVLGLVSFFSSYFVLKIKNDSMRIILVLVAPFIMSYSLYWVPVWLSEAKDKSGEFSAWSTAFIGPWAFVSYLAIILGLLLFGRIMKSSNKNG